MKSILYTCKWALWWVIAFILAVYLGVLSIIVVIFGVPLWLMSLSLFGWFEQLYKQ